VATFLTTLPRASGSPPDPPDDEPPEGDEERRSDVDTKERAKTEKARRFKVVFHNDDYTTQDFVVRVLMKFFHKTETEANQIMLSVHHKGRGVAGIYSRDIAETKVAQTMNYARQHGMPLLVTSEPE
jgi:ATP-dependent Clp protease adaptor protein ClpS